MTDGPIGAGGPAGRAPSEHRLHSGFLRSAARFPGATALRIGTTDHTYATVEEAARRWAAALVGPATDRLQRVGVFAYRNETSYIGVLACLFAGAAFVPMHRTLPDERIRQMLDAAELDAVVVDAASLDDCRRIFASCGSVPPCVLAPESPAADLAVAPLAGVRRASSAEDLAGVAPLGPLPPVGADDAAYVLFTSGTTGRPKGVPVSHANACHFLDVNQARYRLTPQDRLTQTFDQTFDLSVFDLFMAWAAGAAVVAMQPIQLLAPYKFLADNAVTVWFSVPSVVALLRRQGTLLPGSMPTLRWSLFCGEALPLVAAQEWQAAAPNSVVENLYGPTELTIACSVHRWDPLLSPQLCANGTVPIGRLYEGLHGLVLDGQLEPVADGEPGELCVAGPQTFGGYLGADAAASNLVDRPAPDGRVRTYYRTGDSVSLLPSGDYAFRGRVDDQVKVGGHRVELSEIESSLRKAPQVVDAVAVGWPLDEDGAVQGIVAFVLGQTGPDAVLALARQSLPHYMLPRQVHVLDAFPTNANGKVDRKALQRTLEAGAR